MEHILHADSRDIDFDRYAEYLRTVETSLPPHVLNFARDPRHFDLVSPSSLHDSWIESLNVRERPSPHEEGRLIEIHLCLLGPQHDRLIHLRYSEVEYYELSKPKRERTQNEYDNGHHDLYTHEVRLGTHGLIEHEILFVSGSIILVKSRDLQHSEEMLVPRVQSHVV